MKRTTATILENLLCSWEENKSDMRLSKWRQSLHSWLSLMSLQYFNKWYFSLCVCSHRKSCDYDAPGYKHAVRNGLTFYVRIHDAGVPAEETPLVRVHRFELTGEERNGGCQERDRGVNISVETTWRNVLLCMSVFLWHHKIRHRYIFNALLCAIRIASVAAILRMSLSSWWESRSSLRSWHSMHISGRKSEGGGGGWKRMTARIDEACGEEKTLKNTGLRSETMRRKMESFLQVVVGMR